MCCTNCSNGLFLFLCSGRIFDFLLTSHAHSLYTSIIGESSSRKTFSPILLNFSHLKLAALSLPACRSRFRRRRREKSRKLPRWDHFSNNFHKFSSNFPPLPQRSALNPLLKRGRSFLRFFTRFFLAEGEKKNRPPPPPESVNPRWKCVTVVLTSQLVPSFSHRRKSWKNQAPPTSSKSQIFFFQKRTQNRPPHKTFLSHCYFSSFSYWTFFPKPFFFFFFLLETTRGSNPWYVSVWLVGLRSFEQVQYWWHTFSVKSAAPRERERGNKLSLWGFSSGWNVRE